MDYIVDVGPLSQLRYIVVTKLGIIVIIIIINLFIVGLCHPGWHMFKDKCYLYMGGVLPFQDAIRQCKVGLLQHLITSDLLMVCYVL